MQGNTDLKAGAITSTQKAIDDNKNSFQTAKLSTSDLNNSASFQAESYQVTAGTSGGSAGAGQDSGSANSTTRAAISGIAGNKNARTGDAETGIQKIFDQTAVTKDINAQVAITQEFGKQAPKAVAEYAQSRFKELEKTNPEEAKKWAEGGIYRVALHTTLGALTGWASGAAGAATIASAAPLMDQMQEKLAATLEKAGLSKDVAAGISKTIAQTTALAVGTAVGGVQGGTMALNVDANNRQLHPTEALLIKQNAAKFAKQLNGGKEPTQAQIDAAQERLTSTTLNQIDSAFDKRITTEDAQAQTFLKGLASQYGNIDAGGGKLFDARGTTAFNNHTINAQYLGQTAPLYNQLDSKDLKGIAPNVRGAYVAYSDASNDPNLKNLIPLQLQELVRTGQVLRGQAQTAQEGNAIVSAGVARTEITLGKGGIAKPGDKSSVADLGLSALGSAGLSVIGDGAPVSGKMGGTSKATDKLSTTTSEFVPGHKAVELPGVPTGANSATAVPTGTSIPANSANAGVGLRNDLSIQAGVPTSTNNVWGASLDDLKQAFNTGGATITPGSARASSSGNSQILNVEGSSTGVVQVQYSPASTQSSHGGQYYKFTYADGAELKVIDPATYRVLGWPENGGKTTFQNTSGKVITYDPVSKTWR